MNVGVGVGVDMDADTVVDVDVDMDVVLLKADSFAVAHAPAMAVGQHLALPGPRRPGGRAPDHRCSPGPPAALQPRAPAKPADRHGRVMI